MNCILNNSHTLNSKKGLNQVLLIIVLIINTGWNIFIIAYWNILLLLFYYYKICSAVLKLLNKYFSDKCFNLNCVIIK